MNTVRHLRDRRAFLLTASVIGFLLVNIPFLYIATFEAEIYREAMENVLALIFIGEAFLLMFLMAYLISRLGYRNPGWLLFVVFSLVGSLAFSIPFFLYLHSREGTDEQGVPRG